MRPAGSEQFDCERSISTHNMVPRDAGPSSLESTQETDSCALLARLSLVRPSNGPMFQTSNRRQKRRDESASVDESDADSEFSQNASFWYAEAS